MILLEIPRKVIENEKEVLKASLHLMQRAGEGYDAAYMEGALNALDWVMGKHHEHIKCNSQPSS